MRRVGNIFSEVLFDRKLAEDAKESSLKVFYSIDVRLTRGGEEGGEPTLYTQKTVGEVIIPKGDAENIQNLHNLIDYVSGLVENGKPLVDELIANAIKTAADAGAENLEDLIQEEDKIIADIDYGFEKLDSVGIKFNKTSGSDLVSFSLKKNNNIIPGTFNLDLFEQQILAIRRRFVEKE